MLLAICLLVTGIMLVIAFVGFGQAHVCASNRVTYEFMLFYILVILLMNGLILFGPFFWIQRYSNSPGNVVWIAMFFLYNWNPAYRSLMIVIGIICILISLATLLVNIVAGVAGVTSGIKRAVTVVWAVGLIMMIINQILTIATYMQNIKFSSYIDM